MTLYVDASAFTRRYIHDEPGHDECRAIMRASDDWVTSRLTLVETPRALHRAGVDADAIGAFDVDAGESAIVELDHAVAAIARVVAMETGVKTLDAIHIASASQLPDPDLRFLTYDERQATAAEAVGLRLAR
jgi:predicted nucleic acid-binding protein